MRRDGGCALTDSCPIWVGVRRQPAVGQGLCGDTGRQWGEADGEGDRERAYRPNGVAFHDGALYVAELNRITRYDNIEANLDHPPKPILIYDNLPSDEAHGWKFIGISPDNKLYVPIGAPGNILIPADTNAQIRRMDLDGKNVEMVATGVRNSVGFDWNPATKDFYFTNNGRDWVSEDLPNDTLTW